MNELDFYFDLPKKVNTVLKTLTGDGFEAYIVGGCVRDLILGEEPYDYDITTSATPEEVKALFGRTIDTGIEHGTVTVMMDKEGFEVTTYRIDGEYIDARHPETVEYTRNLADDLLRRDFTINAMAYNDGLVDLFDGLGDLNRGIIRGVGVPDARFKEDALRMLRAIRFSARFGYEIETETRQALVANAPLIAKVSVERIKVEVDKTLLSKHPHYFDLVYETGLLSFILPDLDDVFKDEKKRKFILDLLKSLPNVLALKWAALLFYFSPKQAKKLLKSLNCDNETMRKVSVLLRYKDIETPREAVAVRRMMSELGGDLLICLDFRSAILDVLGQDNDVKIALGFYEDAIEKSYPSQVSDLNIGGAELMELGLKGREIGEMLGYLLNLVIVEPDLNTREMLLENAKKKMG